MRTVSVLTLAALLGAVMPAAAQDGPPATGNDENSAMTEGLGLLEEGTRLLLRGLLDEYGPMVKELEGALRDATSYYPPEVLPNGDIIIRRRKPLDPDAADPPDAPSGEGIDL